MKDRLIKDYLNRASVRLKVLRVYLDHKDYADVLHEAQEVVELLLKVLLRSIGVDVPKVHDVGKTLEKFKEYLPDKVADSMDEIMRISKTLRKERELAFYGAEDFIPSEEYTAERSIKDAEFVYRIIARALSDEQ